LNPNSEVGHEIEPTCREPIVGRARHSVRAAPATSACKISPASPSRPAADQDVARVSRTHFGVRVEITLLAVRAPSQAACRLLSHTRLSAIRAEFVDTGANRNSVYVYSMQTLTAKQRALAGFIESHRQQHGSAPTYQEIAGHFGFRSVNAVTSHLRLLRQKGWLASEPGKTRSLRITSPLASLRGQVANIPVFGSIPAGMPQTREQDAEGCVSVDVNSIGFKPTRNTFALRVTGESMIGKHILDGDIVVLEHGPEPRNGQVVAALIDGASTLKTFVVKGGKPYLKAENPQYPDLLPAQELMIQGVFKALIRKAGE